MVGAKNTPKCSQLVRNIPLESFRICIGRPKTMGSSSREAQRSSVVSGDFRER